MRKLKIIHLFSEEEKKQLAKAAFDIFYKRNIRDLDIPRDGYTITNCGKTEYNGEDWIKFRFSNTNLISEHFLLNDFTYIANIFRIVDNNHHRKIDELYMEELLSVMKNRTGNPDEKLYDLTLIKEHKNRLRDFKLEIEIDEFAASLERTNQRGQALYSKLNPRIIREKKLGKVTQDVLTATQRLESIKDFYEKRPDLIKEEIKE